MNHSFEDITSRIKEPPTWWDSNGTPRWGTFTPEACPNIYADEVVLMEIACQACHRRFMVEMHHNIASELYRPIACQRLSARPQALHYGDPPFHDCDRGGDTMNCIDLRIVEFWKQDSGVWTRCPSLEITIEDLDG